MCYRAPNALALALATFSTAAIGPAMAAETVWNFDLTGARLAASRGSGGLSYRGNSSTVVRFGTPTSFGLPALPGTGGSTTGIMLVPALTAAQGILLDTASAPNGVHAPNGWTSNYTLIMDVLVPTLGTAPRRSLFNTNLTNGNDGDMFIDTDGSVGVNGANSGRLRANTWHRLIITIGAADGEGKGETYIDGRFVGGHGGTGYPLSSRWALYSQNGADLIMFGDDNTESAPLYIASLMFTDRRLSPEEALALGGPNAAGVDSPGVPAGTTPRASRCIGVIGHRGGDSGFSPENTLASIRRGVALRQEAIELDIRLSSDGIAMLMHDGTLDRTTPQTGNVNALTAAALTQIDNGSWYGAAFAGERIPTLAQALALFRGTGIKAYLDVKESGMGPAIKAAMLQAGLTDSDVWLWAYSRTNLTEFNATFTNPQIVVGETPTTPAAWQELQNLNVVGIDLGFESASVNPTFAAAADTYGIWTSAYTIVTPAQLQRVIDAGFDKMETDYPAMALEVGLPPVIVEGPQTAQACPAQAQASFTVNAQPGTISWEIRTNGQGPWRALSEGPVTVGGATIATASGTNTSSLLLSFADSGLIDDYSPSVRAIVSNACASSTSDPASISVCIGDFDCNGGTDGADIAAFFMAWESGVSLADVNHDGGVDGSDIMAFFNRWSAGC